MTSKICSLYSILPNNVAFAGGKNLRLGNWVWVMAYCSFLPCQRWSITLFQRKDLFLLRIWNLRRSSTSKYYLNFIGFSSFMNFFFFSPKIFGLLFSSLWWMKEKEYKVAFNSSVPPQGTMTSWLPVEILSYSCNSIEISSLIKSFKQKIPKILLRPLIYWV